MQPYRPDSFDDALFDEEPISPSELAAYVVAELGKIGTLSKKPERDLVGSITVTGGYMVRSSDAVVLVDATSGPITITLPVASSMVGNRVTIKRLNAGGNAVTAVRSGTDTIDGATDVVLTSQYERVTVIACRDKAAGSRWLVV